MSPARRIVLEADEAGTWTAHDVDRDLVAHGEGRDEALANLDAAIGALEGPGEGPTPGELEALDLDLSTVRSPSDEVPDDLE